MDVPSHGSSPLAKNVAHLPYDVLLDIFPLLSSSDLVNLLRSCRTLYALVEDKATWRSLSGQYGLHDISHFGGRSWYTVYTRLLHTHGPMLGLWAGDHPFTGCVYEVRLDPGNAEAQGGIIVEMWRFHVLQPEELDGPEMPEQPTYIRIAKIDFTATETLYGSPNMACTCERRADPHRARFELLSPSIQSFYLYTRQGRYLHPDLPSGYDSSWVDGTMYPRLPSSPSHTVDQTPHLPSRPRVPVVYQAPGNVRKPAAVTLSCQLGCIDRARPFLGFENISRSLPRLYPLRQDVPKHCDPLSPQWDPKSLEGVWLGSHGPHGTECLYVDVIRRPPALRAWKITGDENVPRGALSWQANTERPLRLSSRHRELCVRCLSSVDGFQFFEGTGTGSGRGFMPHQRQDCFIILAVSREPLLRVVWVDFEEASAYIRYTRRPE
ncbi:hypothetical protein C8Q77DRAFT_1049894 [Trametes polyzona]|nr:hypothetical protein C8Q77DRAFT_1049894 [Trametes polyzona]